mmetsp:Transcript_34645/g.97188  ORF Transcript_34645/g.97188 Transcript_34645/m.97188 type:complete len:351 (+) Transcript_34645:96-1148(+)
MEHLSPPPLHKPLFSSPQLRAAGKTSIGLAAGAGAARPSSSSPSKADMYNRRASHGARQPHHHPECRSEKTPWQQGWHASLLPPLRAPSQAVARSRTCIADSHHHVDIRASTWPLGSNNESRAEPRKFGSELPPQSGLRSSLRCNSGDVERCDCCSKEDFWSLFDVFESMDRRGCGTICRADFVWALSALGASSEYQRAVRRTKLAAHFRATVHEVSLEDFIRLAFPCISAHDVARMQRWAALRRARNVLSRSADARPDEEDLHAAFALLACGPGGQAVPAGDLVRAGIITRQEAMGDARLDAGGTLGFEDFHWAVRAILVARRADEGGADEGGPPPGRQSREGGGAAGP